MMASVGIPVDEIVTTCDPNSALSYALIHSQRRITNQELDVAMKVLEGTHGMKGSNVFGYETIASSSLVSSDLIEDHPGFQILVLHEQDRNCEFNRWTADGFSGVNCGYNLLKAKLMAQRTVSQASSSSSGASASVGSQEENKEDDTRSKRQRVASPVGGSGGMQTVNVMVMDQVNSVVSSAIASAISSSGSAVVLALASERDRLNIAEKRIREMEVNQMMLEERGRYEAKIRECTAVKERELSAAEARWLGEKKVAEELRKIAGEAAAEKEKLEEELAATRGEVRVEKEFAAVKERELLAAEARWSDERRAAEARWSGEKQATEAKWSEEKQAQTLLISQLQAQASAQTTRVSSLEQQLAASVEDSNRVLDAKNGEIASLRQQLLEKVLQHEQDVGAFQTKEHDMLAELAAKDQALDAFQVKEHNMLSDLEARDQALDVSVTECDRYSARVIRLGDQLRQVKEKLKSFEQRNAFLFNENVRIMRELGNAGVGPQGSGSAAGGGSGPRPASLPVVPSMGDYSSVIRLGADSKVREFMFLFTGQGVDFSVFNVDCKMQRVEYCDVRPANGFKYCVMHLHRKYGRRYTNLINVVEEYNQKVRPEFQLAVKQELFGNQMRPAVYVRRFCSGNPLWAQITIDRAGRPSGYKAWTNRLNKRTGLVLGDTESDDGTPVTRV
jgi:hypothetical protein